MRGRSSAGSIRERRRRAGSEVPTSACTPSSSATSASYVCGNTSGTPPSHRPTVRSVRMRRSSTRFRIRVDDRRILTLRTVGRWEGGVPLVLPQTFEADVAELEGEQALVGTSDPARRLRSLIDPALLLPRIQFETERRLRYTRAGWFSRGRYAVVYDVVTVRSHQMAQAFEELKLRELARGRPGLDRLARAFQQQYGLRPLLVGKADRAAKLLRDLESGALAQVARGGRGVAVVAARDLRQGAAF